MTIYLLINLILTDTVSESQDILLHQQILCSVNFTISGDKCICEKFLSQSGLNCASSCRDLNEFRLLDTKSCISHCVNYTDTQEDTLCTSPNKKQATASCSAAAPTYNMVNPANDKVCICIPKFVYSDSLKVCQCDYINNFKQYEVGPDGCRCSTIGHYVETGGPLNPICVCDAANNYVKGESQCICNPARYYFDNTDNVCKCLPANNLEDVADKTCKCKADHIYIDQDRNKCVPKLSCPDGWFMNLEQTQCVVQKDCGVGTIITGKQCACNTVAGFILDSGVCVCSVKLGLVLTPDANGVCYCDIDRGFILTPTNYICTCNVLTGFELQPHLVSDTKVCFCDILRYLINDTSAPRFTCKCGDSSFQQFEINNSLTCQCSDPVQLPSYTGLTCVNSCVADKSTYSPTLKRCVSCNLQYSNSYFSDISNKCLCNDYYAGDPETRGCEKCSDTGKFVSLDGQGCVSSCSSQYALSNQKERCVSCADFDPNARFDPNSKQCVCAFERGYAGNLTNFDVCTKCADQPVNKLIIASGLYCVNKCETYSQVLIDYSNLCATCDQFDLNYIYSPVTQKCVCRPSFTIIDGSCTLTTQSYCDINKFLKPNIDYSGCDCISNLFEFKDASSCWCKVGTYLKSGSCFSCPDSTVPSVYRTECVGAMSCKPGYLNFAKTGCLLDTKCGVGAIINEVGSYSCVCDTQNGFIFNQTLGYCVCDVNRGYLFDQVDGKCMCNTNLGFQYMSGTCSCNTTRGFSSQIYGSGSYADPLYCLCNIYGGYLLRPLLGQCICDSNSGFGLIDIRFQCQCNTNQGFATRVGRGIQSDPYICNCDIVKGFSSVPIVQNGIQVCQCDNTIGFLTKPVDYTCSCDSSLYLIKQMDFVAQKLVCKCFATLQKDSNNICQCVNPAQFKEIDKCVDTCTIGKAVGGVCKSCQSIDINSQYDSNTQSCTCVTGTSLQSDLCRFVDPYISCQNSLNLQPNADNTTCICKSGSFENYLNGCRCKLGLYLSSVGNCISCTSNLVPNLQRTDCILKSTCTLDLLGNWCVTSCDIGQIIVNGQCQCDSSKGYISQKTGSTYVCFKCSGISYPDASKTSCISCAEQGQITDQYNSICFCDTANGFYLASNNKCKCNANTPYLSLNQKRCVAQCSEPNSLPQGQTILCGCDDVNGFYLSDGKCVCKPGLFLSVTLLKCIPQCEQGSYETSSYKCSCMINSQYDPITGQCLCKSKYTADSTVGGLCKINFCDASKYLTASVAGTECVCLQDMVYINSSSSCICTEGLFLQNSVCQLCPASQLSNPTRMGCVDSCPEGSFANMKRNSCLTKCESIQISVGNLCQCDRLQGFSQVVSGSGFNCVKCLGLTVPDTAQTGCETCPIKRIPDAYNGLCICDPSLHYISNENSECVCDRPNNYIADSNGVCQKCIAPTPYSDVTLEQCNQCDTKLGYSPNRVDGVCKCAQEGYYSLNETTVCMACNITAGFAPDKVNGACVCQNSAWFITFNKSACSRCDENKGFAPDWDKTGKCVCNGSKVFSVDGASCLDTCAPLSELRSSRCGCVINAEFKSGSCVCSEGFKAKGNSCNTNSNSSAMMGAIIGVVFVVIVGGVCVLIWWLKKKKIIKDKKAKADQDAEAGHAFDFVDEAAKVKELQKAKAAARKKAKLEGKEGWEIKVDTSIGGGLENSAAPDPANEIKEEKEKVIDEAQVETEYI
ncbi:High_cysteine membrane protein Group 1 [Hexamita inflata]|uniref:High cysteine membrane protein Group 1 n=1 Tax=Hexamita inflata TaxID=28002 RepID=A0AA86UE18_9EUKA|nr:High cysteine membrane protein Group 1 [Hexamita inflata]